MSRVYNFSAGPAVLPEPVLKEVAAEMMDYQGSKKSISGGTEIRKSKQDRIFRGQNVLLHSGLQ